MTITNKCPKTNKDDCPLCGRWLGWIDLRNPGRRPTTQELTKCCADIQTRHDKAYQQEFNNLRLI